MNIKAQCGQATTELAIGLLVLMMCFGAFIIIADLCTVNLQCLIAARPVAEINADNRLGDQGETIAAWEYTTVTIDGDGTYRIPFAANDRPGLPTVEAGYYVPVDGTPPGDIYFKDLLDAQREVTAGLNNDFVSDLSANQVFLFAADLAVGRAAVSRYTVKLKLDEPVARMLHITNKFTTFNPALYRANAVYMPVTGEAPSGTK